MQLEKVSFCHLPAATFTSYFCHPHVFLMSLTTYKKKNYPLPLICKYVFFNVHMSGTDTFYFFIPLASIFQTAKWKNAPQIFHVLL